MKKLMVTIVFLSFGVSAFAAQFKTVTENVGHGTYTATISYPKLLSNSVPAHNSINEQVRSYLVENGCDTEEPMDPDLDYNAKAKIVAINKDYVGYEVAVDSYCGGPNPSSDTYNMTFDSKTGWVVEMEKEIPIQRREGIDDETYHKYQTELATIMYKNLDKKSLPEECYEGNEQEAIEQMKRYYPLITGLAANKKVVLRVHPPHFAAVCAFSVRVGYDVVKAYADPQGNFQKWLK